MTKTILLVNNAAFLRKAETMVVPGLTTVVATSSEGMVACKRAGLDYQPLHHWGPPEAMVQLGWRNYRELTRFCEQADPLAQQLVPGLATRGIKPFRFSYYDAKSAMDSLSLKLLCLRNLFREQAPEAVVYDATPNSGPPRVLPGIDEDDNLITALIEDLDLVPKTNRHPVSISRPPRRLHWKAWLHGLHGRLRAALSRPGRIGQALLFESSHDIPAIMPLLAQEGLALNWPPPPPLVGRGDESWLDSLLARVDSPFQVDGCSYLPVMRRYYLAPLARLVPSAERTYDRMLRQVRRSGPGIALTSTICIGLLRRVQMAAAQAAGLTLVTYQEGAGYGSIITPIYDYAEMADGDLLLTYGAGNVAYYRDLDLPSKTVLAVGSARRDQLLNAVKQRESGSPYTIMYVGTQVKANQMHCPNNGLCDTYYFQLQLGIFEALAALPDNVQVLARLHPGDLAGAMALAEPRYARIKIDTRPMEETLGLADAYVIDFPSTVLLNACLTDSDILLLVEDGVSGMTEKQREDVGERTHLFSQRHALFESIARLDGSSPSAPKRRGRRYLMEYGLLSDDGLSARRAVDVLLRLAMGKGIETLEKSTICHYGAPSPRSSGKHDH